MNDVPHDSDGDPGSDAGLVPVLVQLPAAHLAALDAWIARRGPPHPSRGEAIRELLAGTLGAHRPSTTLPSFVTGRDIV